MQLKSHIENHEYAFIFIVILLVVTVFNLHNVFGLDILLYDDNRRYYWIVNDHFEINSHRSITDLLWLSVKLLAVITKNYSVEIARLYVLLVYMVPLSCLLYIFNRKILNLSKWVSLASAVIINIIPSQFEIPAFLDGTYVVTGMLAFVITLILTAQYLSSSRNNIFFLIASSISWLLACDLMNEMGILLFPAYLYFIHSSDAEFKRKLHLYLVTSFITFYRLYIYFHLAGTPSNKPTEHSLHVIASRIMQSIDWWLPISTGTKGKISLGILMAVMLLYTYIKSRNSSGKGRNLARAYTFYGIWFLACSFPFWFLSIFFSHRYFYIPYIALTTITFITLYQVFILPAHYRKPIATVSIIIIFSLYGTQRYLLNVDMFNKWNKQNSVIYSYLSNETVNQDTQIALVNINNGTSGNYYWSSGYLQYMLKKPGVRGIMGDEYNFYDPFIKQCRYVYRMSCIDTGKELIAFKKNMGNHVIRMTYFLQWENSKNRDSGWTLYNTDINNRISTIASGTGLSTYKHALSDLELTPEQVLWGNYNSEKLPKTLFR